jgi:FlaA1/EpsC-like NDP-sugar epimerase
VAFEEALEQRDRALLTPHPGRRARVALFGASATGRAHLARVRAVPHLEARCFLDNNPKLWSTTVEGLPVLRPEPAVFDQIDVIVLCSAHAVSITAQIVAAGYAHKLLFDAAALERAAVHTHSA